MPALRDYGRSVWVSMPVCIDVWDCRSPDGTSVVTADMITILTYIPEHGMCVWACYIL